MPDTKQARGARLTRKQREGAAIALRAAIAEADLTAAEVARQLNVRPSAVSNWTSTTNLQPPGYPTLLRLEELLGTDGRLLAAFGFSPSAPAGPATVEDAIRVDPDFSAADKRVLLEVVRRFREQGDT